jgi:hypothetical protein
MYLGTQFINNFINNFTQYLLFQYTCFLSLFMKHNCQEHEYVREGANWPRTGTIRTGDLTPETIYILVSLYYEYVEYPDLET